MSISQKVKDVTMRNLRDTIFYMKMNALQDFHTCISVPLIGLRARQHKKYSRWVDKIYFFYFQVLRVNILERKNICFR